MVNDNGNDARLNVPELVNAESFTIQDHPTQEPLIGGIWNLPMTLFSSEQVAPGWDTPDRSVWMRRFWRAFGNDMLAAVLATAAAKVQTQNWTMAGPEKLSRYYHTVFRDQADFYRGWGNLMARGVVDYYTQDNGWFIERLRSSPEDLSGPCLGLAHLDSQRMFPSGNAEYPWYYHSAYGQYRLLHRSQVIRIVDLPDAATNLHDSQLGFCALSRTLSTAIIMTLIVTMKREKLSDLPPSALAVFNNISRKQFESAISLHGVQEDNKGNTVWREILPLFGIDPQHPAQIQFISLREVWEGFDDQTAANIAAYSFAAGFRMDPREFWPVSAGPLGTGKEAEIQHQKAKSKSTGLLFTELERKLNSGNTLPEQLLFKFEIQDMEEEAQRAAIHQTQITNIKGMQDAGANLSAEEIRYLLVKQYKVLPRFMMTPPAEGEKIEIGDIAYYDDVERQATKEYSRFGRDVIIHANGQIVKPIGIRRTRLSFKESMGEHLDSMVGSLDQADQDIVKGDSADLRDESTLDSRIEKLSAIPDDVWDLAIELEHEVASAL